MADAATPGTGSSASNIATSDADVIDVDLTSYLSCLERTSLEVFAAELISRHPRELRRLREVVRRPVSSAAVAESLSADDADIDSVDDWCAHVAPAVSDWLSRARAYMSAGADANAVTIAQALTTETVRRIAATASAVKSNKRRRTNSGDVDDHDTTSTALNVLVSEVQSAESFLRRTHCAQCAPQSLTRRSPH